MGIATARGFGYARPGPERSLGVVHAIRAIVRVMSSGEAEQYSDVHAAVAVVVEHLKRDERRRGQAHYAFRAADYWLVLGLARR